MTDDIVARLRRYKRLEFYPPICSEAADEIERLRNLCSEHRSQAMTFYSELVRLRQQIRGTTSDGEASASDGYLNTGESVQTEKAD